ncbi:LolA family protein [Desulfovibrio oxyclinae]|uniref:LolA family protein n=1 Tax=Desulfovibrio oxyclinae TaxID=63560 RepID=UPI0003A540CE|nr:outer membrane lipoprotein carrier protein LolA [Desulfovibrio oxyclinae]
MITIRPRLAVVLLAAVLAISVATPGMAQDSRNITDRIQKRYDTLETFQGRFEQVLTNAATRQSETRTGYIWYRQPSLVRWVTMEPEKEVLVIGEDVAWDYFEEDLTAFKYSVEGLLDSKTILRFISGKANLQEDFLVKTQWVGEEEVRKEWGDELTILQLTPKEPEPGMVQAYIGVEPETALLRRILIVDFMGNANDVSLLDVEVDREIPESKFAFTPPENVVVEDNTAGY